MEQQLQFDRNRRRAEFCPCGKSNKDSKFIPFKGYTGKGYCHSCSKTFLPELKNNSNEVLPVNLSVFKPKDEFKPDFISLNIFHKSLMAYENNNFIVFLKSVFTPFLVDQAISKYKIGTSKHWKGATIFWQIDDLGNVRTGKVMLYDSIIGKRVKTPFDHITWVHSILKMNDFKLGQVFFGTHLSRSSTNTIAIVESEKTAIIASLCFPDITWLAAGSMDGLKTEKLAPLKNRKIILYPDANAFELWTTFAQKHNNTYSITVSSLLNNALSTEQLSKGEDIADFLLREVPNHLKPSENQSIGCEKNSQFQAFSSKIGLTHDSKPLTNIFYNNELSSCIEAIKSEIQMYRLYHLDDIKILINKHSHDLSKNYAIIIQDLLEQKVLEQNPFDSEMYYQVGSAPF